MTGLRWHRSSRLFFHLWWRGWFTVVIGDQMTGYRFALVLRGRPVIRWRYQR